MKYKIFLFLSGLLVSIGTQASMIEVNGLYFSDTMTTTTDVVTSRLLWDAALGVHLGKKIFVALSYGSFSSTDQTSTTTTFTTSDTGIRVGLLMGKQKNFVLSGTYNFIGKAYYKLPGASEVELRGTSIRGDIGYNFWLAESFALALKIIYYAPSFIEQVSGTTLTTISYKRSTIAPGINLYFEY